MSNAPDASVFKVRRSRRAAIEAFFREHLGERFSTSVLHDRFGSAFRTRVSEINRDPQSAIRILNATSAAKDTHGQLCERSVYWSELRAPIQEPSESPYMRRRREEDAASMPLFAVVR